MFDGKKINSLETSVATLTEELNRTNETIASLYENMKNIVTELNKIKSEKDVLENKYDSLCDAIKEMKENAEAAAIKSNTADVEHETQLQMLRDNNDRLIKKCEELQMSNVQIMNQHNDMIKRYEQSILGYAEQAEHMKNNVLKKMNANNIISVVEE